MLRQLSSLRDANIQKQKIMPRAKNAVASRARRKKVLSQTRGNFGAEKMSGRLPKTHMKKA